MTNDNLADAEVIDLAGENVWVSTARSNAAATLEAGEDAHPAYYNTGHTLWWKWTTTQSGNITVDTILGNEDTELGIYSGPESGPTIAGLTKVASDSDSGVAGYSSLVTFPVVAGTTYYIQVGGYETSTMNVILRLSLGTTPLTPTTTPPPPVEFPMVENGENAWQEVDFSELLLSPDTSIIDGKLVSNALEPTPIGFTIPRSLGRDSDWDIYIQIEVGGDLVPVRLKSSRVDGTYMSSTKLEMVSSQIGSDHPWLRTTLNQDTTNWNAAGALTPPELGLYVESDAPVLLVGYRAYAEVIAPPADSVDMILLSIIERGDPQYNDETASYTVAGSHGETSTSGILMRYMGDLDPTKYYKIDTKVVADGSRTIRFLVQGTPNLPINTATAGTLAPAKTANTYPLPYYASTVIGPGIGEWDRIAAGDDLILWITGVEVTDVYLFTARISETTAPVNPGTGGPGGGGGGDGPYSDQIASTLPLVSWEFDDTSGAVAHDSSDSGMDGTYDHPELVTYGVDSLIGNGSGTAVQLEQPGQSASSVSLSTDQAALIDLTNGSQSIEISVVLPDAAPFDFGGGSTPGDTVNLFQHYLGMIVNYTHSGGPYAAYGEQNHDMLIVSCYNTNYEAALVVTNVSPGEKHLIQVTLDGDGGLLTLRVDGEITPEYTGLVPAGLPSFPNPAPFLGSENWPDAPFTIGGQTSGTFGTIIDSFHFWDRALTADESQANYEAWSNPGAVVDTFGTGVSNATGADLQVSSQSFVFAPQSLALGSGAASADAVSLPAQYAIGRASAIGRSSGAAPRHTVTKTNQTPILIDLTVSGSYIEQPSTMTMQIIDKVMERTPTALTVVLGGAVPGGSVKFYVNNVLISTVYADSSGSLSAVSITLPAMPAGNYTLNAVSATRMASDTFTLNFGPTTLKEVSPDADPVEVPGALRPNGTRSWVLQDLLPGGLGSYVFERNPVDIGDRPVNQRKLTSKHASAPGGQHHVYEALSNDFGWKFAGVTFTEEDQEVLYRYWKLNRRIYLIDQRNRAWIVSITDVEIVPRLRKNLAIAGGPLKLTDWMADYTVTVVSHDRTWRTPIPLED